MTITDLLENVAGEKQRPMKATDMLRMDHTRVRDLIRQYRSLMDEDTGNIEKRDLARQIEREISVHSRLEEEIFYPAVRKSPAEDVEKLVLESFEEHALVDQLIEQVQRMKPEDESFDAKMKVLFDLAEHHMDEEESEVFPDAEELGERALDRLGREMFDRKQQLMTESGRRTGGRGRTTSRTTRTTTRSSRGRGASRTTRSKSRSTRSTSSRSTSTRRTGAKSSSRGTSAASRNRARGRRKTGRSSPSRRSSR